MRRLTWLVAVACAICGCKKTAVIHEASPPDNVLARVGSEIITIKDFQEAARTRRVGNDPVARLALLDELIEFRALVQEAKARGYDRDPQMQRALERLLAHRVRAEFEAAETAQSEIPSAEIERYYHEHQKEFTVPAKIRAAMIFVEAPKTFTEDKRAERRSRIEEARTRALKETIAKETGFGPLAAEYSFDQATKYKGGDLGYLVEGLTGVDPNALEPAVSTAAFTLRDVGQISDIIETQKGYYVIKLTERQSATVRPIASARHEIIAHFQRERAINTKAGYKAQLLANKNVEIYRDRLAGIPNPNSAQPDVASPPPLPGK